MKILLLEDDVELRTSFARRLRNDGYSVDEVGGIDTARAALDDTDYGCLVLDRFVPDGDALDLVSALDHQGRHPPVLFVSAFGEADHRIEGLNAGADDYISKPVRLRELSLRVEKAASQMDPAERDRVVELGRVTIDPATRLVTCDGDEVTLAPVAYAVLEHLAAHRERRVPTDELIRFCWDRHRASTINPLPPVISGLRRTFRGVLRIDVVRNKGYQLHVARPKNAGTMPADGPHGPSVSQAARHRGRTTPI